MTPWTLVASNRIQIRILGLIRTSGSGSLLKCSGFIPLSAPVIWLSFPYRNCMRNVNKSPKIPHSAKVREIKKWSGIQYPRPDHYRNSTDSSHWQAQSQRRVSVKSADCFCTNPTDRHAPTQTHRHGSITLPPPTSLAEITRRLYNRITGPNKRHLMM